MKPLGLFVEFGTPVVGAASLRQAARSQDSVRQRRSAGYLLTGTVVRSTMGMTRDVLDGEQLYLSESLVSDGDWFWRKDLAHYVMKYNVELAADFYEHAASHHWSPGVLNGEALAAAVADVRAILEER